MHINDIVENFAEMKESAIGGHPAEWAAFQEWERALQQGMALLPHSPDRLYNFRVGSETDEVAVYADIRTETLTPGNRAVMCNRYLGWSGDRASAEAYCEALNARDRKAALRAYAPVLLESYRARHAALFEEHARVCDDEEDYF